MQDYHIRIGQRVNKQILAVIRSLSHPPKVVINCDTMGGDFLVALEVYRLLKGMQGVTTVIEGVCRSAGVIIWLGGERREIKRGGWLYIHDVSPRGHRAGRDLREILEREGVEEVERWLKWGRAVTDEEARRIFRSRIYE